MLAGPDLVAALTRAEITDVVWIPDSELGQWNNALTASDLRLVRVCREGEAFALAGGLWLGGRSPVVLIQCTGLFEAGDALRNILFDLGLPLPILIGVRSARAWREGRTRDNCAAFTEPILNAWGVPYTWATEEDPASQVLQWIERIRTSNRGQVLLWPE